MNAQFFPPMYRFNTWANEHIRESIAGVDDRVLRRPLDLWFESVHAILVHLCAGEAIWIARLRDGVTPSRLLSEADVPTGAALVERWRELDAEWEAYVATLTDEALSEPVTWTSTDGDSFTHYRWQLVMHVPFHSSEHRAQAAVALTSLGIPHGPQDFHLQFIPPEAAARRMAPPGRTS